MADLKGHTAQLLSGFEKSATFIGWSLGGIYARELSKTMGRRVRQVITIGTPFNASADHTNVGWIFRLLSGNAPPFDAALSARLRSAPSVPTTSIYSRSDGVVAWQTCRHEAESQRVQDLEVNGSHVGLGWNRSVLRIVADRLGASAGALATIRVRCHRAWRGAEPGFSASLRLRAAGATLRNVRWHTDRRRAPL